MSLKKIVKSIEQAIKRPYLALLRNRIGKDVEVCKGAYVSHSEIGDYCYLGMYSYFNHVQMGRYCSISGYVTIGAMEHDYNDVSTSTHLSDGGYRDRVTHIGDDVWIGAQCVIRQGVTIGQGAVIGANSFVNKDVPPYAIAFGSPAKVYKYRFDAERIREIEASGILKMRPAEARGLLKEMDNRICEMQLPDTCPE